MTFWTPFILLILLFLALARSKGAQVAIGIVVLIVMSTPVCLMYPFGLARQDTIYGSGVDLKVAVTSICVVLYCFIPGRKLPKRFVPLDGMMLCLIAVHIASDLSNDGPSWMMFGRACAEWYLPYIAGRLAFQCGEDLELIWPTAASVAICIGILAVIEAFFRFHLLEAVCGIRPLEGAPHDASRWGIKRAYGPTMHPIYLGALLLLGLGWAGYAAWTALRRKSFALWVFAPLAPLAGILCTGSRGPILAIPIAVVGSIFAAYRKLRLPLAFAAVLLCVAGYTYRDALIGQLEVWSGESKRAQPQKIVIEDETLIHSGTRNRINLIEVYKIALQRSGLLGFGTKAVTGFPVNVPVGPREAAALKRTKFIDNTYVLITLRFGYLGLGCFALASLSTLAQLAVVAAHKSNRDSRALAICMFGSLSSLLFLILTVWMPPDFGFPMIWVFGASSSLLAMQSSLNKQ